MNVRFTPQALADLSSIRDHIAEFDPLAADRVLQRIKQAVAKFESHPLLGRDGAVAGTREFPVAGLSYTIVYQILSAGELDVLTIVHQRKMYPPSIS